jgi:hypothetical protein
LDQCESGHDEVFFVYVVSDGQGKVSTGVTGKCSINDDDDDLKYLHDWILKFADVSGFLDVGLSMWEDDGGYGEIAGYISKVGAAAMVVSPAAGVALQVVAGLVAIFGSFDDDDWYGDAQLTWPTPDALAAAVGTHKIRFNGKDWSGDSYDFRLTASLYTS